MDRDARFSALPETAERIAVRRGWNYNTSCQLLRLGLPMKLSKRISEIAHGLASEAGIPFEKFWGVPE